MINWTPRGSCITNARKQVEDDPYAKEFTFNITNCNCKEWYELMKKWLNGPESPEQDWVGFLSSLLLNPSPASCCRDGMKSQDKKFSLWVPRAPWGRIRSFGIQVVMSEWGGLEWHRFAGAWPSYMALCEWLWRDLQPEKDIAMLTPLQAS